MLSRKSALLALTAIFTIVITTSVFSQSHSYGALKEDVLPSWIKPAPSVMPQDGWDEYCDLSQNFPPVGNQGGQGSCTAWAAAYYFKTYQEWEEHGWNLNDYNHRMSPAFVYNQINGGGDNGSYPSDAFKLLCDMGCAPYSVMPYTDQNCTTMPSEEAYYYGIPYRSVDAFEFNLYQSLAGVKAHLLNGHPAVIAFTVYSNFDNISNYNNTYCLSEVTGEVRGGHAVTLCGFDDNKVTSDGIGAFRVANSWGATWGDNGYFWFSYEAMQSSVTCWGYALYCTDRIDYQPSVLSVFRAEHSDRYALKYQFGIGDYNSPDWSQNFFDFYISPQSAQPYPASNVIVDLTDGAAFINSGNINDLYMRGNDRRAWNGLDGSIMDFTVVELTWPASASSPYVPVTIPDNGSYAYTTLQLEQGNSTSVSGNATGLWSSSGSPYYVTGDIIIPDGETLIIEPGTEIKFLDHYSFHVEENANLQAVGTENDPIVFSPLISAVGWGGIRFHSSSGDSRLEHCQIKYGKAVGEGNAGKGGGVYCYWSNPTIENCLIEQCKAIRGGAIYCKNAGPEILGNIIKENYAEEIGGAIYSLEASPLISNNEFLTNNAVQGGAIYCDATTTAISHNDFINNYATFKGGALYSTGPGSQVFDNQFSGNHALKGGSIACEDGDLMISSNTLESSTADQGAAVYATSAEIELQDNVICGNEAPTGGGIYGIESSFIIGGNEIAGNSSNSGGGINMWFCDAEITDNQITENVVSGYGGGIYMFNSETSFANTVLGNNAANNGGGIYQINSNSTLINCTIANNVAGSAGGGISCENGSSTTLLNCIVYHNTFEELLVQNGEIQAYYSNVQGGWEGEGNIAEKPWFISQTDFHLNSWSPSIGMGVNSIEIESDTLYAPIFDLEGNPRPNPSGSDPDQGAYEHELGVPTAVEPENSTMLPLTHALYQNHPNPFNPSTTIRFDLPHRSMVNLRVYDITGRQVAELVHGNLEAGQHETLFDATELASGVYFYRMIAGNYTANGKMVLMK